MSDDTGKMVAAYGAAWLEPDAERRLEYLERCWSENGCYTDPTVSLEGRQALADHIGGFHAQMPGARIELTSGASAHHTRLYFKWRMVGADGKVAVEGVDFGRIADDGRIAEIVGFFGPPPAL